MAILTGQSPSQLERNWTSVDIAEVAEFERRYDLPDAYFAAGRIATAIYAAMGGADPTPADVVPYYKARLADEEANANDDDDETNRANLALTLDALRARNPS